MKRKTTTATRKTTTKAKSKAKPADATSAKKTKEKASVISTKSNAKDTIKKKESIWDGLYPTGAREEWGEWEEWERGNHRQFYKPERLCSDGCSLKITIDIEGTGPRGQFHVLAQTFRGSREYCGVIGGIAYWSHIMIAVIKGEPPTDNYTGQEALYIVKISESRETFEGFNYTIPEYIYWGTIREATEEERKEVFALYGVVEINAQAKGDKRDGLTVGKLSVIKWGHSLKYPDAKGQMETYTITAPKCWDDIELLMNAKGETVKVSKTYSQRFKDGDAIRFRKNATRPEEKSKKGSGKYRLLI